MGIEYEEKRKKSKFGKAEVRALKDKVKIIYVDEDDFIREFPIEDVLCPIYGGKDLFVSLSKDETQIMSIRPYVGTYAMKIKEFMAFNNEPPKPYTEAERKVEFTDKEGNRKSFMAAEREVFTVLLEVIAPGEPYDGVIYPVRVPYAVDRDVATGNFKISGAPSNCRQFREFLEKFGVDFNEDSIPHSSNILPQLEELLLEKDKSVFGVVTKGYVNTKNIERIPVGFEPQTKKKRGRKPKVVATQLEMDIE